jgi:hypothetical protein
LAHLSITEAPPEGPETGSSPAMQIRQPEISNGKMRFFPEVGEFYFKNDPVSYPVQDEEYVFEVVIDSITQGSIYGVVGGILTMPFMTPGQHAVRVRAGPDKEVGVLGQNTDAVIDRVSVRQVRSN